MQDFRAISAPSRPPVCHRGSTASAPFPDRFIGLVFHRLGKHQPAVSEALC